MNFDLSPSRRGLLLSGAAVAGAAAIAGAQAAQAAKPRLPKMITDCQGHVWKPGGPKPSSDERQEPLPYQELLATITAAGVQRLVIVTPSWNPDGNAYPLLAAKTYPQHFHVMGLFNPAKPPTADELANWKKTPNMLGMRMFLSSPAGQKWFTDGSSDWVWPILEKHQIPVMIYCYPQIAQLTKVIAQYPHLKIILDSFEVPTNKKGAGVFDNYKEILALAKYPNVGIKCESVPFLSAEGYPYKDILPFFKPTYDSFGPERMFWGSDMTLLKPPYLNSYMDCVRFMTEIDWMTDKDLQLIMGESISKWVGWPQPA